MAQGLRLRIKLFCFYLHVHFSSILVNGIILSNWMGRHMILKITYLYLGGPISGLYISVNLGIYLQRLYCFNHCRFIISFKNKQYVSFKLVISLVLWSYPDTFFCIKLYLYLSILCFIFVISSCNFENYISGWFILTFVYINRCNKLIFMFWMNLAFPGWTLLVYDILLFLCVADCEFCRYFYFVSALS